MSVVTKTGDDGKSRWGNKVVDKDSELLEAVGTLDELQAVVGMVRVKGGPRWTINDPSEAIEKDLWSIMGSLACDSRNKIQDSRIKQLEKDIKELEERLPRQTKFRMPGENELEAWLNLARTVCRRAERKLVKYSKVYPDLDKNILIYINRLSDYLFIISRLVGQV